MICLRIHAPWLPPSNTVIEILETVKPEPAVIAACRNLREKGYVLALDDFSDLKGWDRLANLVSVIKVDFRATSEAEQTLAQRYAARGICMLAEKIETQEEFEISLLRGILLRTPRYRIAP